MRTKIGSPKFSGNYNFGLNAARFVKSRRQGVPGYVPLPLLSNGKICQGRLAVSPDFTALLIAFDSPYHELSSRLKINEIVT
jgi:hypothetical protein